MSLIGQLLCDAFSINRLHFHPNLLNGQPRGDAVLADTHPPLSHKMILIPPTVLKMTVRMTALSRHQFHPHHVGALHPPPARF